MGRGKEVAKYRSEKRNRVFGERVGGGSFHGLITVVQPYQIADFGTKTGENDPYKGRKIPEFSHYGSSPLLHKMLWFKSFFLSDSCQDVIFACGGLIRVGCVGRLCGSVA